MKLGLVTDIHEQVEFLREALACLAEEQVDQVVVIGDICETGQRLEETCCLLQESKAVGVWGNHDFGLSVDPDQRARAKYSASVIEFMTSLRPRLVVAGCHFTHVEPWLDPMDLRQLWYFEGPPDESEKRDRIFDATKQRIMFAGHCHCWLLVTPEAISDWKGQTPVRLDEGRYYAIIGALCDGRFATFDTNSSELIPFDLKHGRG